MASEENPVPQLVLPHCWHTHYGLTSIVSASDSYGKRAEDSVLCQPSLEGTVFGVLHTPRESRRPVFAASVPSVRGRADGECQAAVDVQEIGFSNADRKGRVASSRTVAPALQPIYSTMLAVGGIAKPYPPILPKPGKATAVVRARSLSESAAVTNGTVTDKTHSQAKADTVQDNKRPSFLATEILKKMASVPSGKLRQQQAEPKSEHPRQRKTYVDEDHMAALHAIQELDKSLEEAMGPSSSETSPIPSSKNMSSRAKDTAQSPRVQQQQAHPEPNRAAQSKGKPDGGVQTDNLIEEAYFPGSNRRSYLTFPSKTADKSTTIDSIGPYRGKLCKEIQVQAAIGKAQQPVQRQTLDASVNTDNLVQSRHRPGLATRMEGGPQKTSAISASPPKIANVKAIPVEPLICSRVPASKKPSKMSNGEVGDNDAAVTPQHTSTDSSTEGCPSPGSRTLEGAVVPRTTGTEENLQQQQQQPGHFVVVAIDFGTTYSGYAFSFTRDPENIHMMRKWEGGDPGVINQKSPTTLLLTPACEFHSFGFSARDHYHDLDPDEARRWMYFEKFKMTLHSSEDLGRETEIRAANGKVMPAMTVFAHALRYFKENALQELSDQSSTTILNEDIRWVVTVPAIWRQQAKQFMRASAYEAGIASPEYPDQLLIALEPEAASIYCRKLRMHQLIPEIPIQQRMSLYRDKQQQEENSEPAVIATEGTRYMVVDCGGGTVDITVHELQDKRGTLKELHKATGGPHGSVGVDMEFEKLLTDIFGADFIEQFKVKRPAAFVDLMVAFEARKRNASPFKITPLNISLPFSFIDYYKKCKGYSVETSIKKFGHKDIRWSSQGMLRLEPTVMLQLFRSTVDNIKQHITNVLNGPDVIKVDYLFLVGGFAESQILQKDIRDSFCSQVRVIIPQGVSLAILRGAVLFGLDPTVVNLRRSHMTYGVGVLNRFIHGLHPPEKMVVKDDVEWCADVFDRFVTIDQSVGLGDVVLRSYTPARAGQNCSIIHIYCSDSDQVSFVTDPGVKRCGTLMLDLSDTKYLPTVPRRREIQTRMIFGDTEIKVSALDIATGNCVRAEIDFLSH